MKKILILLVWILSIINIKPVFSNEIEAPDLKFSEMGGGKFIYCNNPEPIGRANLSDNSNPNSSYIMNNYNIEPDKYILYICHANRTEIKNVNGKIIESGFDIELDVQFKANKDTKILLNSIGFEVPKENLYYENGELIQYEDNWACLNAVANYMQRPIYRLNSNKKYIPQKFEPVEIDIKTGEELWLSDYIYNYQSVGWLKPVHIIADIQIIEGNVDINVAALKSNSVLKDRTNHNNNAKFGIYYRDRQYKGIANTLPQMISTKLNYTIDDNTKHGTALPVKVYNQYNKEGNKVDAWITNINPQADIYARNFAAETDMIKMSYYDESKLNYYGKDVGQKNSVWNFDVFHSDTKNYTGLETGYTQENYIPNYELGIDKDNIKFSCNLGNYGVTNVYNLSIKNDGTQTKYFNYKLTTISNNIVNVKNENGEYINSYSVCKSSSNERKTDIMACVELPPNQTTNFSLEVTLTINYPGGMENKFEITDTKPELVFLNNNYKKSLITRGFTGKEFFKWYDKRFYISYNNRDWFEKEVSDEFKQICDGNWNNYELKCAGDNYTLRWCAYDSAPNYYKEGLDYYKSIYILDKDFKITNKYDFDKYPSEISFSDGIFFVKAGSSYYSQDGINWVKY